MEVKLLVLWTKVLDEFAWPVSCPAILVTKNGSADVGTLQTVPNAGGIHKIMSQN